LRWTPNLDAQIVRCATSGGDFNALASRKGWGGGCVSGRDLERRWLALLYTPEVVAEATELIAIANRYANKPWKVEEQLQLAESRFKRRHKAGRRGPRIGDDSDSDGLIDLSGVNATSGECTVQGPLSVHRTRYDRPMDARAMLHGKFLRYFAKRNQFVLGRAGLAGMRPDVDLAIEGSAGSISRRQAVVTCDEQKQEWWLQNTGRRRVHVNGVPVRTNCRAPLPSDCLLRVGPHARLASHRRRLVASDLCLRASCSPIMPSWPRRGGRWRAPCRVKRETRRWRQR